MTKQRLLLVSFSSIASDARVLKQVDLLKDEYQLETCGYGPAPDGVVAHHEIPAELQYWRYSRERLLLRDFKGAYWGNPVVSFVRDLFTPGSFDIVFANDVDTLGLAAHLAPRRGFHSDLHEYAPRQKEYSPRWRLFVAPFIRWMCRTYLPAAASVTTVGRGIAAEYSKQFGVQVDVVRNASPPADLKPVPAASPIRLVHSGAGIRDRALELMVEAVALTSTEVTLDLFLTRNDDAYVDELVARSLEVPGVTVHDPVSYRELVTRLNDYDVGVLFVPPKNFSYLWSLPNKFFDFVQARLGVVAAPLPEVAQLIEQYGIGAVSSGFRLEDLVATIDALTVEQVNEWKRASDASALELSSESEVAGWERAVAKIATA